MSTTTAVVRTPLMSVFVAWVARHWFAAFLSVYGLWVLLPFLAPVFMRIGWDAAGRSVYSLYSFFCHQLPERSFFLFGQKVMYSLSEIQSAWQRTSEPAILRQFIGNEAMGWKVAWSDRMISFYTSVWLFALFWFPLRRKIHPLSWWGLALLLLPMVIDGGTHLLSDVAGIGKGFRDTNAWLAVLTRDAFPTTFYTGDALGSFNSLMRLTTGPLAGLGIVWLAFPHIFHSSVDHPRLDGFGHAQISEQVKDQDPRASGG